MFTGIIEETGVVRAVKPSARSIRLTVEVSTGLRRGLKQGDSVAVNGCCLTAVGISKRGRSGLVQFDILRETWSVTNLQFVRAKSLVNLERPLRAAGRLDGHFVTGHVDGVGTITGWEQVGRDWRLDVKAPRAVMKYIVHKGSIAVDGISLTVAQVRGAGFRIWIIPHTLAVTALRDRRPGDAVNLEGDILGKYVAKFVGK